jgi:U3 small nucleolar RNA-associated protein 16
VPQKINFHNTDYNLTHNDELTHQTLCSKRISKNSMFSRLYKSAKSIFTDSAETEKTQPTPIVELPRDETMVTTRQKDTQTPADREIEEKDSINVYVPSSSSSKRQRKGAKGKSSSEEDEAEYVPPSSRKRKRLPVRAKDAESPDLGKTRPVVEIPVKKISPDPDHANTGPTEEEEVEDTEAQDEEHNAVAAETLENSKHRRFGSEPAEDEFFSIAREVVNDEENQASKAGEDSRVIEDSEDSEDDAPEAVGIQEAAKNVKLKDREAARVVKE